MADRAQHLRTRIPGTRSMGGMHLPGRSGAPMNVHVPVTVQVRTGEVGDARLGSDASMGPKVPLPSVFAITTMELFSNARMGPGRRPGPHQRCG